MVSDGTTSDGAELDSAAELRFVSELGFGGNSHGVVSKLGMDGVGSPYDPYHHSKVMAKLRCLRLKRATTWDEEVGLGTWHDEGQWVPRLVVHIGSRSCTSEVDE